MIGGQAKSNYDEGKKTTMIVSWKELVQAVIDNKGVRGLNVSHQNSYLKLWY